ncbi:MAG: hypothetical protein LBJ67_10560 [Planctomycetaceae bacterium]|jgi:hypothetical protein|nr:hypothetical protein [Planctomycetaceae bacterium]
MTRKYFQQHRVCQLLLLQFIFWAVCGQGLHLWGHSDYHSHSEVRQNSLDSHADHLLSSSETHDSEHCSVCSFYQSLQNTFFVLDAILNETALSEHQAFSENRLSVFDGIAGLFLRGPPSLS